MTNNSEKNTPTIDVKSFWQDNLKYKTRREFAELIGYDEADIMQWEENRTLPLEAILKILSETNVSFEELTHWKKPVPKPLEVNNTWKKADFTKRTIIDYIASALNEENIPEKQREEYIRDLHTGIINKIIKPKLALIGHSDTGKSTLINSLLGADKMPTSWTPTTAIAVYIKHVSDRPDFITEDAWIFANPNANDDQWDVNRLNDEDYCRSWKIAAGDIELLPSFGTRQGDNYEASADSAVVFVDAPILNTCDIIDLPGFGTDLEKDDIYTKRTMPHADIVIYLSQANSFMRSGGGDDTAQLKNIIDKLPHYEERGKNI